VCHKQQRCSGLSRAECRPGVWRCRGCNLGSLPGGVGAAPGAAAADPNLGGVAAAPGVGQPLTRDEGTAKCPVCRQRLRPARYRLVCATCSREHHNKCSGLSREETARWATDGGWRCQACVAASPDRAIPPAGIPTTARRGETFQGSSLRVVQWNIDGVGTGLADLGLILREHAVDVCLLQESKLNSSSITPKIRGYASLRRDRPSALRGAGSRGGGLLIFIKEDLPFREVEAFRQEDRGSLEALAVEIPAEDGVRCVLVNVYAPPVRQGGLNPNWSSLVVSQNRIFAGDWNCHSPLWDPFQPADRLGEELEEWVGRNQLGVVNDGAGTRMNRGTGGWSCPDITVAPNALLGRVEWSCLDLRGSDHVPIFFEVDLPTNRLRKTRGVLRWGWANARWEEYRSAVDSRLEDAQPFAREWPLKKVFDHLTETLLEAARAHVGMVRARAPGDPVITPEVRAETQRRNRLGRGLPASREEWVHSCQEVVRLTAEAKQTRWRSFVESLSDRSSSSKAWGVLRSLSGVAPSVAERNKVMVHEGREYATDRRKADLFVQQYADVSRHHFSPEERRLNLSVRRELTFMAKLPGPEEESCGPFTMGELRRALRESNARSAEGPY